MKANFLRLAAFVVAAQYALALPHPTSHGTGHYATQVARAGSVQDAGIPVIGSIVDGVISTVLGTVSSAPGGASGGVVKPAALDSLPALPIPLSALPALSALPMPLPTVPIVDVPSTGNLPSKVNTVNPRDVVVLDSLHNSAAPQQSSEGDKSIYHVERSDTVSSKLLGINAAYPQCPPETPNCTLSESSGSKNKAVRQLPVSGAGASPKAPVTPKTSGSVRDSGSNGIKTPLSLKREDAVGVPPTPIKAVTKLIGTPKLPASPPPVSIVNRQVHNADYSSDNGPSGNPPPSPSSAAAQDSPTAPKSAAPKATSDA